MKVLFFGLLLIGCLTVFTNARKPIFCYWGTWSHYRKGNGQFRVENIDGNLCSHIMYAFFGASHQGDVLHYDTWLDTGLHNIQKTVGLKRRWPHLKIIASIGGAKMRSQIFSAIARNGQLRDHFANSVLAFVRKFGFDGVDIDWEYPGQNGGDRAHDKMNFVLLMEAVHRRLKPAGYQVMIATAAAEDKVHISYDLRRLVKFVDYILVMAYDFHGSWDRQTGHNAPLQPSSSDNTPRKRILNVKHSIGVYLRQGFPPYKLILGVPLYGRTFTLSNPASHGVGSPVNGAGNGGPYTRTRGILGYNEVCERVRSYRQEWDGSGQVPYAYAGNQWVTYDNPRSVENKARYALGAGLGGTMVWSIETDDFHGRCGGGSFPLLKTLNRASIWGGVNATWSEFEDSFEYSA